MKSLFIEYELFGHDNFRVNFLNKESDYIYTEEFHVQPLKIEIKRSIMTLSVVFGTVGGIINLLHMMLTKVLQPYSENKFKDRILKLLHFDIPKVS